MKGLEFPIIGTRTKAKLPKFDLASPQGRKAYFQAKVPGELKIIRKYLKTNTFIAYILGKKNSGKGTYSKMFTEIFGEDKVATVSVGDLIREIDDWKAFQKTAKYGRMKKYYRGYISFEDAVKAHLSRSTSALLPTEFVLALIKAHIDELEGRAIFIDGLPREMDQVSYSLYFRDLINYRDDPDMFILIDIPESVIAARIKSRVICPKCKTSRSIKFLITSKVEYDVKAKEFYLVCDNPTCSGARMVPKEGDDLGITPIKARLKKDEDILRRAFELHGISKVLLRNHIPVAESKKYFENYEFSPEYIFKWDAKKKLVKIDSKPWTVKDDNGIVAYSLLAPAVIVSMLKQMAEILRS